MEVVGKCVGVRSDSDVVYSKVAILCFNKALVSIFSLMGIISLTLQ